MDIHKTLCQELNLKSIQVTNTLKLLGEGATVPFISRYRKEMTSNLDETQIRELSHKFKYYTELEERKKVVLDSISGQGKLTPELQLKIVQTVSKTELEDLYLPFKPKRKTRATKAREAGLEPLSEWLLKIDSKHENIELKATSFINPEKGIESAQEALNGACDIIAENLSDTAENRKWMRNLAKKRGFLISTVRKDFSDQKTKFQMYYDYKEKAETIASHRLLAILRGEREKILKLKLEIPTEETIKYLENRMIKNRGSAAEPILKNTIKDALDRLLLPATETEIRKELRVHAENEAIKVFSENLRDLLLASPAGQHTVLGIDPGFRTGCKIAAVDKLGNFLATDTIYPHEPKNKIDEAKKTTLDFIKNYAIEFIAIGNGTASRETEQFVRNALKELPKSTPPQVIIVSEAGASVYSASEVAKKEFPEQDVTVRGSVSIARRLQDPLSELVKIDPKSIGVGQYQHDVNQTKLKESLDEVIESCVNLVGVDVNLASEELLKYVSGLSRTHAGNILAYRIKNGAYKNRESLKKVPGLGEKTFEQAAGFLRISGASYPLDNSAVHPERYKLVEKMARSINTSISELIGNKSFVEKIEKNIFISEEVGLPTIEDIISELEKPGRDPRESFQYASFSEDIKEISDLIPGMILEGVVTNVTNFGGFVDVGVHQDGLVHISEIADDYIDDPRKFLKIGQIIKVKVLKVDIDLKRIALSKKSASKQ